MNGPEVDNAGAKSTGIDNVEVDGAGTRNKIRSNDKSEIAKGIRVNIIIRKSKTHILVSF